MDDLQELCYNYLSNLGLDTLEVHSTFRDFPAVPDHHENAFESEALQTSERIRLTDRKHSGYRASPRAYTPALAGIG